MKAVPIDEARVRGRNGKHPARNEPEPDSRPGRHDLNGILSRLRDTLSPGERRSVPVTFALSEERLPVFTDKTATVVAVRQVIGDMARLLRAPALVQVRTGRVGFGLKMEEVAGAGAEGMCAVCSITGRGSDTDDLLYRTLRSHTSSPVTDESNIAPTVYRLIKEQGGNINVEEISGSGATVHLYFPLSSADTEPWTLMPRSGSAGR